MIEYQEYLKEKLNESIGGQTISISTSYNEYLTEQVDRNINFSEYLSEVYTKNIKRKEKIKNLFK